MKDSQTVATGRVELHCGRPLDMFPRDAKIAEARLASTTVVESSPPKLDGYGPWGARVSRQIKSKRVPPRWLGDRGTVLLSYHQLTVEPVDALSLTHGENEPSPPKLSGDRGSFPLEAEVTLGISPDPSRSS